jgi:single-stranded DNA-binding protein
MARNNAVYVIGDITSDIYYGMFTQKGKRVPYLRVFLMINRSKDAEAVKGLRIAFYGLLAERLVGYLQKGTRLFVEGHIQIRIPPSGLTTSEIVGEYAVPLRNANEERGRQRLEELIAQGKIRPDEEDDGYCSTSFVELLGDDFPGHQEQAA